MNPSSTQRVDNRSRCSRRFVLDLGMKLFAVTYALPSVLARSKSSQSLGPVIKRFDPRLHDSTLEFACERPPVPLQFLSSGQESDNILSTASIAMRSLSSISSSRGSSRKSSNGT